MIIVGPLSAKEKETPKFLVKTLDGLSDLNGIPYVLVHPSRYFYTGKATENFDNFLEESKTNRILLSHNDGREGYSYFVDSLKVDEAYFSDEGEHQLRSCSGEIHLGGGYMNACFRQTVHDFILNYLSCSKSRNEPLHLYYHLNAIYRYRDKLATQLKEFKETDLGSFSRKYIIEEEFCLSWERERCVAIEAYSVLTTKRSDINLIVLDNKEKEVLSFQMSPSAPTVFIHLVF